MADFLVTSGACLVGLAVLQAITCAVSLRLHRFSVVDVIWGPGLVLVAVIGVALGSGGLARRLLLLVLVGAWGLRLGAHILQRARGAGEDPRYAEMVEGRSTFAACLAVFGVQGIAQWFISLPIQVAAVTGPASGIGMGVMVLGAAVSVTGMVLEAVADRQLRRFKSDPDHHGQIMDRGIWGWSRHPNYFGDACVWTGVYLVAAAVWPGALTILSPAAMVWFLVVATGARRLERHMAGRPGYQQYQARTSFFVPIPPRRLRAR